MAASRIPILQRALGLCVVLLGSAALADALRSVWPVVGVVSGLGLSEARQLWRRGCRRSAVVLAVAVTAATGLGRLWLAAPAVAPGVAWAAAVAVALGLAATAVGGKGRQGLEGRAVAGGVLAATAACEPGLWAVLLVPGTLLAALLFVWSMHRYALAGGLVAEGSVAGGSLAATLRNRVAGQWTGAVLPFLVVFFVAVAVGGGLFLLVPRGAGGTVRDLAKSAWQQLPLEAGPPTVSEPTRGTDGEGVLIRRWRSAFRDDVILPILGRGEIDPTPVLEVKVTGTSGAPHSVPDGVYLRGWVLDHYRDGHWTGRDEFRAVEDGADGREDGWVTFPTIPGAAGMLVEQEVLLAPLRQRILFAAARVTAVQEPEIEVGPGDVLALPSEPLEAVRYRVRACLRPGRESVSGPPPSRRPLRRELRLPRGLERTRRLARRLVAGIEDPMARCAALERHLRRAYTYSLDFGQIARRGDRTEHFLFVERQGCCVHFASAMAVMLRTLGIPSRVIGGFVATELPDAPGRYVARQRDAHAWVEAEVARYRWVRFDPTPRGWAGQAGEATLAESTSLAAAERWLRTILAYDSGAQSRLWYALQARWAWALAGLGAGCAAGAVVLWLRWKWGAGRLTRAARRQVKQRRRTAFFREYLRILRRHGLRRRRHMTPLELQPQAEAVLPAEAVRTVTAAYCSMVYGARELTAAEKAAVRGALHEMQAAVVIVPTPPRARGGSR